METSDKGSKVKKKPKGIIEKHLGPLFFWIVILLLFLAEWIR